MTDGPSQHPIARDSDPGERQGRRLFAPGDQAVDIALMKRVQAGDLPRLVIVLLPQFQTAFEVGQGPFGLSATAGGDAGVVVSCRQPQRLLLGSGQFAQLLAQRVGVIQPQLLQRLTNLDLQLIGARRVSNRQCGGIGRCGLRLSPDHASEQQGRKSYSGHAGGACNADWRAFIRPVYCL